MQVLCIGFFFFYICLFYLIHLFSDTSALSIKTIQFNFLEICVLVISAIKNTYFCHHYGKTCSFGCSSKKIPTFSSYSDYVTVSPFLYEMIRCITAPPGKPNMEQALSSYCSCPLSAPECTCKLCSETRNELCSMFGIKGRIQPIDLKWGTLLRCLHFGAGAQDPSVVHGNTAPLKWLKTGIFTHTEIPVHKWWLVDNIAGSLLLS